jgi:uncharacterized SAM-binding protein YcdF (DUF218 family)
MMDFAFNLVSKLVWLVVQPQSWLALGLALAFLASVRANIRAARRWTSLTVVLFLGLSILPLGDWALDSLEARYPAVTQAPAYAGIIVLGGGEDIHATLLHDQAQIGPAGDRLLHGAALALANPEAFLLFTGGTGALSDIGTPKSGADVAARIFTALGVPESQMILEHASRNTTENARLSAQLVDPTGVYLLVTSAFHMTRALGSFERAGWTNLTPYPVDFQAQTPRFGWDFLGQTERLTLALKEYLGILVYTATGR